MCLWGFFWYRTPKKLQLLRVNGVVKPIMRNIKTSYYRNNCKNSNEIVHNRNHHHVRFVGGLNMRPTNEAEAHAHLSPPLFIPSFPFSFPFFPVWKPSWSVANGRHFEKNPVLSRYFHNRWTDFDEIWHGDAYCLCWSTVKISNFWKSKIMTAAILEMRKISISQQRLGRPIFTKFGMVTLIGSLQLIDQMSSFWKSMIAAAAILEKSTKCNISATVWPIVMKFNRQSKESRSPLTVRNLNFLKFEMFAGWHVKTLKLKNCKPLNHLDDT